MGAILVLRVMVRKLNGVREHELLATSAWSEQVVDSKSTNILQLICYLLQIFNLDGHNKHQDHLLLKVSDMASESMKFWELHCFFEF